jgi:hypothetical protein
MGIHLFSDKWRQIIGRMSGDENDDEWYDGHQVPARLPWKNVIPVQFADPPRSSPSYETGGTEFTARQKPLSGPSQSPWSSGGGSPPNLPRGPPAETLGAVANTGTNRWYYISTRNGNKSLISFPTSATGDEAAFIKSVLRSAPVCNAHGEQLTSR